MGKRSTTVFILLITTILFVGAACPTMAAWAYSQANPLFFDFAGSGVSFDPCLGAWDELPTSISNNCASSTPDNTARFTRGLTELPSGAAPDTWRYGFSSSFLGIYAGASRPSVGRSLIACKQGATGNSFTTNGLDWGKGISLNTFTIIFGSTDYPRWNVAVGGTLFNFVGLPGNPNGAPAGSDSVGAVLCWITNDPDNPNDDSVGLYDITTNQPIITAPFTGLASGTNVRRQFLLEAKRSPLPWPDARRNNLVLINVKVGDLLSQTPPPSVSVPGLKNKTVILPANTDSNFANTIMLGTSEYSETDKPRGDRYGWVRLYEMDGGDTDRPFHPTGISKSAIGPGVKVTWNASAGDPTSEIIGYRIKRNGTYIAYVDWEQLQYEDPSGSMSNTYEVFAVDSYGNESQFVPDTTPPSVPTNVSAQALGHSEISVSWTASTDNVAVAGYKIYRNNTKVGEVVHPTTTFTDQGLLPQTTYSYTVSAFDAASNESAKSSPIATATTKRANWTYTSANPLVFEFNDNGNNQFTDPKNAATAPVSDFPYATRATNFSDVMFSNGNTNIPSGSAAAWKHTFSSAGTGSLAIRNSGTDLQGRSLLINRMWTEWNNEVNQFRTDEPGNKLDWGNGIVFEVKAKTVGSDDPATWPTGYNWGDSSSLGGIQWNLARFGVLQNPFEYRYNGHRMVLCWKTNKADDPNDDTIGLYDTSSGQHVPEVKYSLGGTPTSAPENVYKVHVKRNPLPLSPEDGLVLANVWVNGVRVIRNELIGGGWTTGSSPNDGYRDDFQIGDFENNTSQKGRGDIYDYVKVYEADALSDTDAPSIPTGVNGVATSYTTIKLTWNESTDASTEVIGYRIMRSGGSMPDLTEVVDNGPSNTTYIGSGLLSGQTYSYKVMAVDSAGNASNWSSPVSVTIPQEYAGVEVNFPFNDRGNVTYPFPTAEFYTDSVEDPWFFFGKKNGIGSNIFWGTPNNYKYVFSSSNGGSLTIQTDTPAVNPTPNGSTWIESANFGPWFRWTNDNGQYRGVSVELDMDIVGDANGWCAPWGSFPAVAPCSANSESNGHQASDWGTQYGNMATLYLAIAKQLDLTETGKTAQSGYTGDGASNWVSIAPNDIRDHSDDRVQIYSNGNVLQASFSFKDGRGFGLVPEDGTMGNPRNGVIEGNGNHIGMKVAVANAGGNSELWDIWVTRPDGTTVHVNPTTCQWMGGRNELLPGWGAAGHTLMMASANSGTSNSLRLGNQTPHTNWGTKYNWVKVRNDWDANVTVNVKNLGDLHNLGVGASVKIDDSGGEKIVISKVSSKDMMTDFFCYIEQEDRSAGIKVVSEYGLVAYKGQKVTNLTGVLARDADGNLYIDVTNGAAEFDTATNTIEPVGMNNLTVGGNAVTGGVGVDNTGILATIWGRVSNVQLDPMTGNRSFELDDGSGAKVKVWDLIYDGDIVYPNNGEYWIATGAVALEDDGNGGFRRALITDNARNANPIAAQ